MSDEELYFSADLRTPAGVEPGYLVVFSSLETACCDVYAGMPDVAAELLRNGVDPMACAYIVRDADGVQLLDIPFSDLLRGQRPRSTMVHRREDNWAVTLADLRGRCDAAMDRFDRATARMARLTARALATYEADP